MGEKAKGPVALALLAGIVLMVIGFRMADGAVSGAGTRPRWASTTC